MIVSRADANGSAGMRCASRRIHVAGLCDCRNLVVVGGLGLFGFGAYMLGSNRKPTLSPAPVVQPVAALPQTRPAVPAKAEAPAGNSYEAYLLRLLGQATSQDKIKDGLGRSDPKVNVYAERGRWARAKVDLDRDEKWDEKWWLKNNEILRATAPADDEQYGGSVRMGPVAD